MCLHRAHWAKQVYEVLLIDCLFDLRVKQYMVILENVLSSPKFYLPVPQTPNRLHYLLLWDHQFGSAKPQQMHLMSLAAVRVRHRMGAEGGGREGRGKQR